MQTPVQTNVPHVLNSKDKYKTVVCLRVKKNKNAAHGFLKHQTLLAPDAAGGSVVRVLTADRMRREQETSEAKPLKIPFRRLLT